MEKAVLVGIKLKNDLLPLSESIEELKRLVATANVSTAAVLTQNLESPHPKFFIGAGKLNELRSLCQINQVEAVIFDHTLSPSQCRNLEEALGIKAIDRTELILDIFAQHAQSREGKLQISLAQASFSLTRLSGHGISLSRLGGGIGTRGPGETKLEMDRRRIRKKIADLKKELEEVMTKRQFLRRKRKSNKMKVAALIGYTNSGKSTLLNLLTSAKVLTENRLFATLDPVTRRLFLENGKTILVTDTVGFIQKLPHQLVSAFRATLEETIEADLLLHVIDSSSPYVEHQINAVNTTLRELSMPETPLLHVFNKIDKLSRKSTIKNLTDKYAPAVMISALQNEGIPELISKISRML